MTSKSPIFPIAEPQHYSDYGFDPQFDYFQVLEEARKHKGEASSSRSIDTLHFKLQKAISKGDLKKIKKSNKRAKWWKNALFFFKKKWAHTHQRNQFSDPMDKNGPHRSNIYTGSISGPIYITESLSGSSTPYRTASRHSSGPLVKGNMDIPYISLKELSMDPPHRISASSMPIYLVT